MSHLPILPVIIPLFAGALLAMIPGNRLALKRTISLAAMLTQIPLAVALMLQACDGISVYLLGNWPAPFGIVLVVDRLSALMLLTTSVLSTAALAYAVLGDDEAGRGFHALFQFQIMGINGAFLTGDVFNLFVFFEVLLIASYGLLLHGRLPKRIRSGLHYLILNIVGSSLFLIAVGTLYGITGTLNMADMAGRVASVSAPDAPLVGAAGLLLMLVFCLKAAAFPLYFWLPRAYASAAAPVAALFAIMTKVGLYAILRINTLVFSAKAGPLAMLANDWLWPVALVTLVLGAIGVLAADALRRLIAYLIIISIGTLLAGVALGTPSALVAALYYLVHSTWITGALFLLAGILVRVRGSNIADRLIAGPPLPAPMLLGSLFLIASLSIAGLPPLSGFIGKLLLLEAAGISAGAAGLYVTVLCGSLFAIIALSRAGSTLFWRYDAAEVPAAAPAALRVWPVIALLAASPLLVIFAQPLLGYLEATAAQLLEPADYIAQVLSALPVHQGGAP
ncbi:MAG: monovalent cation/H+ antiporter subunit D [Smithellaceae bacterium]